MKFRTFYVALSAFGLTMMLIPESKIARAGTCSAGIQIIDLAPADAPDEGTKQCLRWVARHLKPLADDTEGAVRPRISGPAGLWKRTKQPNKEWMRWSTHPLDADGPSPEWQDRWANHGRPVVGHEGGDHVFLVDCRPAAKTFRMHHWSGPDQRWVTRVEAHPANLSSSTVRALVTMQSYLGCNP